MQQQIIECARTWVGTAFVHQGRVKKNRYIEGGCDCIGLVIGIAKELKLKVVNNSVYKGRYISDFDTHDYGNSNTDLYYYIKKLSILDEKPISQLDISDVIIFKILNFIDHIGIYSEKNTIIHSIYRRKKVIEQIYDQSWKNRTFAIFSLI